MFRNLTRFCLEINDSEICQYCQCVNSRKCLKHCCLFCCLLLWKKKPCVEMCWLGILHCEFKISYEKLTIRVCFFRFVRFQNKIVWNFSFKFLHVTRKYWISYLIYLANFLTVSYNRWKFGMALEGATISFEKKLM